MASILTDLSSQTLATSIQTNLHAFFRQLSQLHPAGLQPSPGISAWKTGLLHPWFNGVLAERPPNGQDEQTIREAIESFYSGGKLPWTWWVSQPAKSADWAELLGKIGFRYEQETPGMAMSLENLSADSLEVAGLEILTVADQDMLREWSRVFVVGYGLPQDWAESFYELMAGLGLDLPIRSYLGYLNGEPVATASLFLAEGVAGIYNVATLPEARRKGIGAALTVAPLLEARQLGYQAGILQSSQAGFSVYQKLGFEHLCEIELFVWEG